MASMCFGGDKNGDHPDVKKSKEIEKQLREDQKKMSKEVKMLLLGKTRSLRSGDSSMAY